MKSLISLCVVLLLLVAIGAFAHWVKFGSATSFAVLALALSGIVYLYWLEKLRIGKDRERQFTTHYARLAQVSADASFEVYGTTLLFYGLVETVAGTPIVGLALYHKNIFWFSIGVSILCAGVLTLLHAVPGIGKPLITFSRTGFRTPLTPLIPWRVVDEAQVRMIPTRHGIRSHLQFRIATLPQLIGNFGTYYRLTAPFRIGLYQTTLNVSLRGTKEAPLFVDEVMQKFRNAAIGKTEPSVLERLYDPDRMRRDVEQMAREFKAAGATPEDLKRLLPSIEPPQAVVKKPSEAIQRMERNFRWARLLLCVAALGLLIVLVSKVIRLFL
jgi:hypothetical protein